MPEGVPGDPLNLCSFKGLSEDSSGEIISIPGLVRGYRTWKEVGAVDPGSGGFQNA